MRKAKDVPTGPIGPRTCSHCPRTVPRTAQDAKSVKCEMCVAEMLTPDDDGIKDVAGPATTVRK